MAVDAHIARMLSHFGMSENGIVQILNEQILLKPEDRNKLLRILDNYARVDGFEHVRPRGHRGK